ncbi:MAG: aldehyde dehydrogenase family protein [Deltaproteobacteria bacterium]|nr:aldehyde dehydrogenase family protein [Deltaproteobacteria bacterium]
MTTNTVESTPQAAPPRVERVAAEPQAGDEIVVHNPATGDVIGKVPVLSPAEVVALVERARKAQKAWGALTVEQRCNRLAPVKGLLLERLDDLAEAISRENGKTLQEAMTMELMVALELLQAYLKRAPEALAPRKLPIRLAKHRGSYLHYVPKGVIGIISPWNFPFSIPFGEVLFGLLAGNAVVIKPSEVTPLIALRLRELFVDAGIDPELLHVATGRGATGGALIEAGVGHICFTGSVATGRRVGEACGRALIPCTLELGGKAAAIVCADANLNRTAQALCWGAFGNHGQVCASVERVYVDERVFPELRDRVVAITRKLRQGNPMDDVDVGALTFPPQADKIRALLQDAKDKGAVFETGGIPEPGARFVAPTVLSNVHHGMRVMREESFGPLMPIQVVKDEAEAIRHANDSDLGLLGYVFSSDTERARHIAEQMQAGTVMVNDVLASYSMAETPWQGLKASGIGRTHSDDGLRDMCECRHVNYDRFSLGDRELWWYPYSPKTRGLFKRLMRFLYGSGLTGRLG